jgi:putative acetyltransferase
MEIEVKPANPRHPEIINLINESTKYLSSLYPSESNHLVSISELEKDNVFFVGAVLDKKIVGCGAVFKCDYYGEIKRMYVNNNYRGYGIGVKILKALEEHLINSNINISKLETGIHQKEAIGLYQKFGYKHTAPFGDYLPDPLSIFMEKNLI